MVNKKTFPFTVLIKVSDYPNYLIQSVDSVINQTLNFKENIQIIFIDYEENKESTRLIREYYDRYPENIIILSRDYLSQAYADNNVFKLPSGKYVTFMDGNDYFSKNTFIQVKKFITKQDNNINVFTIPLHLENNNKLPVLNDKKQQSILDLEKEANNPQIFLRSCFIRKTALQNITYDKRLLFKNETILINKLLLGMPTIGIINNAEYHLREKNDNNFLKNNKQENTLEQINIINQLIQLSKSEYKIPDFIAYTIIYDLQNIIRNSNLDFDTNDKKQEFLTKIKHILTYINDNIIYDNPNMDYELKNFIIYLKKSEYTIKLEDDNVLMQSGEYYLDDLNKHKIWIDYVEIVEDKLNISGVFTTNFNTESIKINLLKEDMHKNVEKIPCKQIIYPQNGRKNTNYLGIPWKFPYSFEVTVEDITNSKFTFEVEFQEDESTHVNVPKIEFRISSYFSNISIYSRIKDYIVFKDSSSISVIAYSFRKLFNFELKSIFRILKSSENGKYGAVFWHLLYLVLYRFMSGKRIWLLNDRLDVVDDNAKHLFRYAAGQDDGIREYFILDKKSKNWNEIKQINKNVVRYGSFKHKLIYLFCEKRISSFLNENFFNPFYNDKVDHRKLYNNLVTAPRYFLQHGIISCDLTDNIRRYDHNLALIVTSSDSERQSFFDYEYNYPQNVVQALGLPRYDTLTCKDKKKQILFIPSWRSYLDENKSLLTISDYYKSIQSLLNNKSLIQLLEKTGYTLIFKPHPEIIKYIDQFQTHEYIKISVDDSFQELFNTSSLLITDYSSVIFDFAYLEKPVIYYQPNDDYHYKPGYFNYTTMGFGEIIREENKLIQKIRQYIENECIMEEKYQKRVLKFFKYHDKNNSKRVYDWIKEN